MINPGESVSYGYLTVRAVHAYNTPEGKSTKKVHHKGNGVGYLIQSTGKTIYHAGDTDIIPEMTSLGRVDLAFLPIGGTYTMNLEEAVEAAALIRPKMVIPIHHLRADAKIFKNILEKKMKVKVILPGIGEPQQL